MTPAGISSSAVPYALRALRRQHGRIPDRVTTRTRVRTQAGTIMPIGEYLKWAWYFDVRSPGAFTGTLEQHIRKGQPQS